MRRSYVRLVGRVRRTTEKGFLFECEDGAQSWLPKSQIKGMGWVKEPVAFVLVPSWLAKAKKKDHAA